MARLRDPEGGCPWDREQTFASIAPYTVEEAYEVAESIQAGDLGALREELGDLLFQVVFHARMASESGHFEFADVARAISDKMVRRHPHVFGGERMASAAAQGEAWEAHKAAERRAKADAAGRASQMDGVSVALPALVRAQKLQKRAARVGFDWTEIGGVLAKLREETAELEAALAGGEGRAPVAEELGDLLFTCVNLARHLREDAESALRQANRRFETRFRRMEAGLADAGRPLGTATAEDMDRAWEQAKAELRAAAGGRGPQSSSGSSGALPS
jgi:MazG family protein